MNKKTAEEEKFNKIVSIYDKKIDHVISYYEKNAEAIQDIKQDIYLKLFNKALFNSEGIDSWSWLKKVVSNHCKNYLRSCSKVGFFSFLDHENDEQISNIPDNKSSSISKVDSINLQEYIYKKVCTLKHKYKEVIICYDYENMSYEEIAAKLNCPVGTVKSRLYNARMFLKEELKELLD